MSDLAVIETSTLTATADAIREKTGTTDAIAPQDMPAKILSIETGGSGDIAIEDIHAVTTKYRGEWVTGVDCNAFDAGDLVHTNDSDNGKRVFRRTELKAAYSDVDARYARPGDAFAGGYWEELPDTTSPGAIAQIIAVATPNGVFTPRYDMRQPPIDPVPPTAIYGCNNAYVDRFYDNTAVYGTGITLGCGRTPNSIGRAVVVGNDIFNEGGLANTVVVGNCINFYTYVGCTGLINSVVVGTDVGGCTAVLDSVIIGSCIDVCSGRCLLSDAVQIGVQSQVHQGSCIHDFPTWGAVAIGYGASSWAPGIAIGANTTTNDSLSIAIGNRIVAGCARTTVVGGAGFRSSLLNGGAELVYPHYTRNSSGCCITGNASLFLSEDMCGNRFLGFRVTKDVVDASGNITHTLVPEQSWAVSLTALKNHLGSGIVNTCMSDVGVGT